MMESLACTGSCYREFSKFFDLGWRWENYNLICFGINDVSMCAPSICMCCLLLVFYLIFYSTKRFFEVPTVISSKDRHNSNQHLRPRPFHFYGGAGAPHSPFACMLRSPRRAAQGEKIVLFLLLAIVKFFYCRTEKPMPCALNIAFNSNNNNNGAKSDMIFYTPMEGDPMGPA